MLSINSKEEAKFNSGPPQLPFMAYVIGLKLINLTVILTSLSHPILHVTAFIQITVIIPSSGRDHPWQIHVFL